MVGNILQTVSDNLDKGRKMLEEVMGRSTRQAEWMSSWSKEIRIREERKSTRVACSLNESLEVLDYFSSDHVMNSETVLWNYLKYISLIRCIWVISTNEML